ncbi:uncharacterized protein MELLADRAFT_89531 [Melampsora larici-populina 98AG31]|uniref:Uncharacterized protein n=1 Tax=Melampsora larici-populina (strain 98AG31 / pathotype 3-4-7) TaxID=747676 RepID=F4RTQ1_MELLP|nr:uncharacterized protein MELLADRAFT_89531 [Melampsora larici-populina 98AG31]EGG04300.1 hypothetical protein MELLADRAFT_89531 [Melampsora larici-populina 98AG31]
MSTESQTDSVFLPTSILQYVGVESGTPRLDPELVIERATTSEIREILVLFLPHFIFDETEKDNRELLISIFEKSVARRLSYVVMPSHNSPPNYFKAPLERPRYSAHEFPRIITSESEIDSERMSMFQAYGLSRPHDGNYRLASEGLIVFIRRYKHLNKDEINEIESFCKHAGDALHDSTTYLQDTHESIEGIRLLLREVNLSSKEHRRLENELNALMTKLKSREKTFDLKVEQAGFISALVEHHKKLSDKGQWYFPADTLSSLSQHVDQGGVDGKPHDSKIHAAHGKLQVGIDDTASAIADAYEDSLVALHESVSSLENAHKAIEVIHLLLSQAELMPIQRKLLENSLERKLTALNSRKVIFNQIVRENGRISALAEYQENPFVESASDIAGNSNISPLLKDVEGDKPSEEAY